MQVLKWTLLHAASKSQSPAQTQVHQNGARYLYSGYICLVYSCSSLFLSCECQYVVVWIDPSESSRMCKKMGWDVDSIEESNARVLGFKECLGRPGWTDRPWPRDLVIADGRFEWQTVRHMVNRKLCRSQQGSRGKLSYGFKLIFLEEWSNAKGYLSTGTSKCHWFAGCMFLEKSALQCKRVHKEPIKSPYYKIKRDGAVRDVLWFLPFLGRILSQPWVFWFPRMWVNTWRPGRYAVLDDETEQKNAPWVAHVSHGPGWVSGSLTDVKQFEAILAQSGITCCLKEIVRNTVAL